jgi:hypothetical protein
MTCRRVVYLPAVVDGKLTTIRLPEEAFATWKSMTKPIGTTITNTARLSSAEKLAIGGEAGAVIKQERLGQLELVASNQLPSDGLLGTNRARWEALGLKIIEEGGDDPLFCRVELPAGWQKVPREHALWTDLVDDTGKVRAEIRYKAAFYDRDARIWFKDPEPVEPPDPTATGESVPCVCAECGHEQIGMQPCAKCRSFRTVALSVVIREFGENWRDTCFPTNADP